MAGVHITRAIGAAVAFLALSLVVCTSASAATLKPGPEWFQNLPTANQEGVTDFLYEQSPQGTIPHTGEASEISGRVSSGYESMTSAEPGYEDVATDVTEAEEGTDLIPEVEVAFPGLSAVGTAFAAGWEIGEGINAIFAEIGLGEGSAPEGVGGKGFEDCVSKACGGGLVWKELGTEIYFGSTIQQDPGAYGYRGRIYQNGEKYSEENFIRWFESPCPYSGMTPPPGSTMEIGVATTAHCDVKGKSEPVSVDYPYVLPGQLFGQQTLHPYNALIDGMPTKHSKAPPNPGTSTVETKAEEYFDSNEQAQRWLDYEMDPQDFPNPFITKTKYDHDCDRTPGPTYENPEGNESPEPFAKKEEAPFTVTTTPEGIEPESVYLRWGRTNWIPGGKEFTEEPYLDLWGGWGYRHILAKHGWTALDRDETEAALVSDKTPSLRPNGLWKYEAFDPTVGVGGVECVRAVLVSFEKGEDEGKPDPAPRGIVSSYNIVIP